MVILNPGWLTVRINYGTIPATFLSSWLLLVYFPPEISGWRRVRWSRCGTFQSCSSSCLIFLADPVVRLPSCVCTRVKPTDYCPLWPVKAKLPSITLQSGDSVFVLFSLWLESLAAAHWCPHGYWYLLDISHSTRRKTPQHSLPGKLLYPLSCRNSVSPVVKL